MSLAGTVAQNAETAVGNSIRRREGEALNYGRASLATVEAMLAELAPWLPEMTLEQSEGVVRTLGCYVLEVGRREFGGEYQWHDETRQPVLVVGEPGSRVALMAFGKVRGRLGGDAADDIPFFYEGFAEAAHRREPGRQVLHV